MLDVSIKAFLKITAYWINNDWKMHDIILDFVDISEMTHTGVNLVKSLELAIGDLLPSNNQIIAIICDNASNNDTLFENLHYPLAHVCCFRHMLNLVIHDTLGSINEPIRKLHKLIKKIKNSVQWQVQLAKACESSGISNLKPLLDVMIRWSSMHAMLLCALDIHKVRFQTYLYRF